ncbi:MAG: ferredoxin--NADP reductase [Mariniphaga sp.]
MATKSKGTSLKEYSLTGNQEIAPGVHLITFRKPWNFHPGQVVKIALNNDYPPRIYSLCSGNHEEEAAILFNIKEDGFLTPKLAAIIPGEKILVSEPYGSFTGTAGPAWWIATGTGIAPFYSMFRSGLGENKKLIHGVSFLNQFYFEDELEWALGENYIRCCSRESSCNTFPGRVTDYISSSKSLPTDVKYYLCGKAIMVVEVRDLLISKGVRFEKIQAEIYF